MATWSPAATSRARAQRERGASPAGTPPRRMRRIGDSSSTSTPARMTQDAPAVPGTVSTGFADGVRRQPCGPRVRLHAVRGAAVMIRSTPGRRVLPAPPGGCGISLPVFRAIGGSKNFTDRSITGNVAKRRNPRASSETSGTYARSQYSLAQLLGRSDRRSVDRPELVWHPLH